jgi:hypothetical protein
MFVAASFVQALCQNSAPKIVRLKLDHLQCIQGAVVLSSPVSREIDSAHAANALFAEGSKDFATKHRLVRVGEEAMNAPVRIEKEPIVTKLDGGQRARQTWSLPLDEEFLEEFLTYLFTNYWDQVIFGPIIEGAAYELTCPCKPSRISKFDGYLTIGFDGPHFHLCIGENKGSKDSPTPEDVKARRKPSKAEIFRRLDKDGAPISWGFEMKNGADEPMISIFFASPFLSAGDKVSKEPIWERLTMWRDISKRYLGREAEDFDASGRGYGGGHG